MAQFISRGHDFFACLSGSVRIEDNRAMIEKLWSPRVEARFPGGKDDPNFALLRFDIADAEFWETDMSLSGRVKVLFGGKIKPGEDGSHAGVSSTAI